MFFGNFFFNRFAAQTRTCPQAERTQNSRGPCPTWSYLATEFRLCCRGISRKARLSFFAILLPTTRWLAAVPTVFFPTNLIFVMFWKIKLNFDVLKIVFFLLKFERTDILMRENHGYVRRSDKDAVWPIAERHLHCVAYWERQVVTTHFLI